MPLGSYICMNGIGALSYLRLKPFFFLVITVQKPSGVSLPFLPLEMVATPTRVSPR